MKIRTKFTLSLLSVILIPLITSLVFFSIYAQESFSKRISAHINTIADIQKSRIQDIYSHNIEQLNVILASESLDTNLYFYNLNQAPAYQNKLRDYIKYLVSKINSINSIAIFNIKGIKVASSQNYSKIDDADLIKALKLGLNGPQARIYSLDNKRKLTVTISGPIYKEGELQGVIIINASANHILTAIRDFSGLGETGETILAERNENGDALFLMPTRFNKSSALKIKISHENTSIPINRAFTDEDSIFTHFSDYRGVPVLAATRYIPETNWGLVVKIDVEEAFHHLIVQRRLGIILVLITSILTLVYALYLSRMITAPIHKLTDAAKKIAEGDYRTKALVSSSDEIGELGGAFNSMTSKLIKVNEEIQSQVGQIENSKSKSDEANRSLKIILNVNEMIAKGDDEFILLERICRIIVDEMGYKMAWVGFKKNDQNKSIIPVAKWGDELDYVNNIQLTWSLGPGGKGTVGTAIRTGEPSIINDIEQDPRFHFKNEAKKSGLCSIIALPLTVNHLTIGSLIIYSAKKNSFNPQNTHFLLKLSDDLAYGLMALRMREEKELLNKQLLQAQKMEAVGQLTGGIAHDFNNILTSILGFTSLAKQRYVQDDQPELKAYLEEISIAGERARDLITQMLAFSRNEKSEARLIDLPLIIKEVCKMLSATLPSSISINLMIGQNLPKVIMDSVHLHQILTNLCINARDAIGEKGEITIHLSCSHVKDIAEIQHSFFNDYDQSINYCDACQEQIPGGEYIELTVKDTGTGIDSETLTHIFEPFYTTKDIGKGTGMGLSMVYGLIHQHAGHLKVETEINKGTRFKILLPVNRDENLNPIDTLATQSQSIDYSIIYAKRILVIDDERSVSSFIKDVLTGRGAIVREENSSAIAQEIFLHDPMAFDLVISDQTMPDITGLELVKNFKAIRQDLPMILCTGYSEYVCEETAKERGFDDYISKPMQIRVLLGSVVAVLSKKLFE